MVIATSGLLMALAKAKPMLGASIKSKRILYLTAFKRFSTGISMHKNQTYGNEQYDRSNQIQSQTWTIPNALTASRILLSPAIGYFIWNGMPTQALYCFTFAAITDFLDGYLARKLNQQSHLGAILDPVADKLLMTTSFVSLYSVGIAPIWLVGGFIGRDVALLGGGALLRYTSFRNRRPSVKHFFDFQTYPIPEFKPTLISKCNTVLQCSLILIHLGAGQVIGYDISELDLLKYQLITASTTAISFGQYLSRQIFPNKPTHHHIRD